MKRSLKIVKESWPFLRPFTISRGTKTTADVILVELEQDGMKGRAECVPYPRYNENIKSVAKQIADLTEVIEAGLSRAELQAIISPGAARNALDCALWDLEAKLKKRPVWELAGLPPPKKVLTAVTIGIDTPDAMGRRANELSGSPLIKVKLDSERVLERLTAVRSNAPNARLIIDPNEGWAPDLLDTYLKDSETLGVEMVEQPLFSGNDERLLAVNTRMTICADESCHYRADLKSLIGKYSMINIKLDKTGGLTEALAMKKEAEAMGLTIMVGCMTSTSLAMAPAMLIAQGASIVDLDGPLFLKNDRNPGLRFDEYEIFPAGREIWG
ncbi:MAG: L-Ala-D/L-Glu epimerase [Alphaproteobacteria bacterium MarineAlpha3_Bin5]|nr:L-Ala-D/L-Glu epimerase [Magnetovibrio sp.]PPR78324.1 MAG: L-Ala-D/L-Glu epimerase [Alphaproteobacteria bacterium MarineAlpha3_Bin5]